MRPFGLLGMYHTASLLSTYYGPGSQLSYQFVLTGAPGRWGRCWFPAQMRKRNSVQSVALLRFEAREILHFYKLRGLACLVTSLHHVTLQDWRE